MVLLAMYGVFLRCISIIQNLYVKKSKSIIYLSCTAGGSPAFICPCDEIGKHG